MGGAHKHAYSGGPHGCAQPYLKNAGDSGKDLGRHRMGSTYDSGAGHPLASGLPWRLGWLHC